MVNTSPSPQNTLKAKQIKIAQEISMKQKHEFDNYIKNYRQNLNQSLALSGETSGFFALYKAKKLREWLPELSNKKISIL